MKAAILSESPPDEAGIRILVEGILASPIERVPTQPLRTRGWPSVLDVLPAVILRLHYHTDAEALAVVVDSNRTAPHRGQADRECEGDDKCRLCLMRNAADKVLSTLSPVHGRERIKVAFGLASPAVEAWYLCGVRPGVSERAWYQGMESGNLPYDNNRLKRDAYGTDRPSLGLETQRAEEACRRLAENLKPLEDKFPFGFGTLAAAIRAW